MRNLDRIEKIREIMDHVAKLFDYYGESADFFDEFMEGVLKGDIDMALVCFRDLRRHIELFPRKEEKTDEQMSELRYQKPFVPYLRK